MEIKKKGLHMLRNSIFFFFTAALTVTTGFPHVSGGADSVQVEQNKVFETSFESARDYANPFLDAPVKITFTAPSGKIRTRDAFWDGGRTWRIRFSPDEVGDWRWRSECSDKENKGLHAQSGTFKCAAYTGDNPLYKRGPIRVSKDGFYFEHKDGTPFFWLGDTGWAGVLMATPGEWDHYLRKRKEQGYTLIQVCATHYRSSYKDKAGETFYSTEDGIRINPAFFQRVDDNFAAINRHGMMIASVILWEGKGKVPETNLPVDDIIRIARYIVARYDAYQIAWILGGDGAYFQGNRDEHWKKIGRGVFSKDRDRLVTIHPSFWAANFFRDESWHDFIGYQSGHGDSVQAIRRLTHGPPAEDWKINPPQPVLNIEPCYEEITSYTHKKRFKASHVRTALYWSLTVSPTAGVTYGHSSVYRWYDGKEPSGSDDSQEKDVSWREALNSEGTSSVVQLKRLFETLPWWKLRPAQDLIVKQPSEVPEEYVTAAKTGDGEACLVYLPVGGEISLRTETVKRSSKAKWFNPRTGEWTEAGNIAGSPHSFNAPDENDWVLCIKSGW